MLKISNKQENWRHFLYKQEIKFLVYKTIRLNWLKISSKKIRQYLQDLINQTNRKFSYTRTRNICILTGRSRSVYRFFRISRLKFREYASSGYFIGIRKSSW